jgi:hypothetical protein
MRPFLPITLLALIILACGQSAPTAQVAPPSAELTSSDDLCTWFFQTQALRTQRLSGLNEFTNWSLTHDFDSLTRDDVGEMVAILVRYQPYQGDFIVGWKALGPHPQAREFWELELESVQLRIESINAMAAALDRNDAAEFSRAWEMFAQSQSVGNRGESAMLAVRAQCVP